MPNYTYEKDKTLAEIFTHLLISFECYRDGGISKTDYENMKSAYLYNKSIYMEVLNSVRTTPEQRLFSDPNKMAVNVLNDLIEAGAINTYEYNTLKERHLLYK